MKKLLFMVLAVMVMATPMVNAQKINKENVKAKLEKADATLLDAKKNGKAATWISHAKAYYDAATVATKDLYPGMTIDDAMLVLGEPTGSRAGVELAGVPYNEFSFPWVTVYVNMANTVTTWFVTDFVVEGVDLCDKALQSLNKAYELDAKQAKKIGEELAKLDNYYKQNANVSYDMGQYADAAYFFSKAFDVASNPAYVGQKDGSLIYNAGYLYAADGQRDPKSYEKAVACLNKALAMGYTDEKGDIYYFLYVCYANLTDSPVRSANMEHAKQLLMEGLAKHPDNSSIVEGLIDIYTSEESGNNPADLIELVDKAVERDPQNVGLWFGRGRVFYAMENLDEAIASFKKVTELNPNDAMTWYYLGYFYSRKGDNANEAYYQRDYTSYEEANKDMAAIVEIYKEALPYLEKAHELDPEYFDTIQLLKELTFRLRDEEGIMEKYNKYNELYKQKAQ